MAKKKRRRYYCKHCKKWVFRYSDKKWIKSWCDYTGKDTHMYLMKKGA